MSLSFFQLLAGCHPSYSRWYEKNSSNRKALQLEFQPSRETFLGFFAKKRQSYRCFLGWATYFSIERGEVPALPSPVRVEPVEDRGALVILTPERLISRNPEHVALARHVQSLLEERGLLKRIVEPRSLQGA